MRFAFVYYRPLAWIAFATLVLTPLLGLGWLIRNRQAAGRQGQRHVVVPARLIWVHDLVAASSLVLTVLTADLASMELTGPFIDRPQELVRVTA